jgi:hypothetical protein
MYDIFPYPSRSQTFVNEYGTTPSPNLGHYHAVVAFGAYLDARRLGAGGRALACRRASADRLFGAAARRRHKRFTSEGSGVTIRIRYRILNARLAAGAVSAGRRGGMDVVSSYLLGSNAFSRLNNSSKRPSASDTEVDLALSSFGFSISHVAGL